MRRRKKGLRTALVTVGGWWGSAPKRRWIVADIAEGLAVARIGRGVYCLVHTESGRRMAAIGSLARCRALGRILEVIPGWTRTVGEIGWGVIDTVSAVDRALPDRVTGRRCKPRIRLLKCDACGGAGKSPALPRGGDIRDACPCIHWARDDWEPGEAMAVARGEADLRHNLVCEEGECLSCEGTGRLIEQEGR